MINKNARSLGGTFKLGQFGAEALGVESAGKNYVKFSKFIIFSLHVNFAV